MNRFSHTAHLVAVGAAAYPLAVVWELDVIMYRWIFSAAWLTLAWLPAIVEMIRQWEFGNNG